MIGLKIKNSLLKTTLLSLLPDQMECYQTNHSYQAVLTDMQQPEQSSVPVIFIGDFPKAQWQLSPPFSLKELNHLLETIQTQKRPLQHFLWQPALHQLEHVASHRLFQLTQKESDLLDFLFFQPQHTATKKIIMEQVWHYKNNTLSHTLNSHLYGLHKKLGTYLSQLLSIHRDQITLLVK